MTGLEAPFLVVILVGISLVRMGLGKIINSPLEIIEGYYLPTVLLSHLSSCRLYGEKSTFRLQAQVFVEPLVNLKPTRNPLAGKPFNYFTYGAASSEVEIDVRAPCYDVPGR